MAGTLDAIQLDTPAKIESTSIQLHQSQGVVNYVHGTLGIPMLTKPGEVVTALPHDLTSLNDNALGDLLNIYGQWTGYIDYQLARADGERQSAEAYLSFIQARVRIEIKSRAGDKKPTTQDKNDIMETHPQVIDAREKYMFWESTYRLTKSIRDSVQLAWETVSRRITQRGQEVDRMRRETNVAGVPAVARTFRHSGG